MSWNDTALMDRIEHYLDVTAYRHNLLVGNVANIDTPHYHTRDIDFQSELRRAELQLTPEKTEPHVHEVLGLIERPDGNNVSMDREGLLLAETQLGFRVGVQLLQNRFQRLLQAIREGS